MRNWDIASHIPLIMHGKGEKYENNTLKNYSFSSIRIYILVLLSAQDAVAMQSPETDE